MKDMKLWHIALGVVILIFVLPLIVSITGYMIIPLFFGGAIAYYFIQREKEKKQS